MMEGLYAKLYDKYDKLKKLKSSEIGDIIREQDEKYKTYLRAQEELIQQVQSENEMLRTQVNNLKNEVASIRSSKDELCAEYQKLLMEENEKYKVLSEECERLQRLFQQGRTSGDKNDNVPVAAPGSCQVPVANFSNSSSRRKKRKHSLNSGDGTEGTVIPDCSNQDTAAVSRLDSLEGRLSQEVLAYDQQPECCKRSAGAIDSARGICLFQALLEGFLGMELSAVHQPEGLCASAVHRSSGLSFSLTWIKEADGTEPELMYRVSSLGTFERVAPEWMREEAILFSTSMCPMFFERVGRLIKNRL